MEQNVSGGSLIVTSSQAKCSDGTLGRSSKSSMTCSCTSIQETGWSCGFVRNILGGYAKSRARLSAFGNGLSQRCFRNYRRGDVSPSLIPEYQRYVYFVITHASGASRICDSMQCLSWSFERLSLMSLWPRRWAYTEF